MTCRVLEIIWFSSLIVILLYGRRMEPETIFELFILAVLVLCVWLWVKTR